VIFQKIKFLGPRRDSFIMGNFWKQEASIGMNIYLARLTITK